MRQLTRFHVRALLAAVLVASASCGPDEVTGRSVHVYLPSVPQGSGGSGGVGGGAGGSAGVVVEPPGPPMVDDMSPDSGPYGTEVRIRGTDLGSSAREATLTLGAQGERELVPNAPEVSLWSETEIRFRFPFPLEGQVVVTTPEGMVVAGEFTPTWDPGPPFDSVAGVTTLASIASGPGRLSAVLDTGPPRFVEFDGEVWSNLPIPTTGLLQNTIRLYLDENDALSAFSLTNAGPPGIATLDPSADFASTPTGVSTGAEYALTGGPEGAAVWFRSLDQWNRAAPANGTWAVDRGPFTDPWFQNPHHTAGATSAGGFVIGWSEDTGDLLDHSGAIFTAMLLPGSDTFTARARTTPHTDDHITGLSFSDRGSGLVATYCGSDVDPLGATETDYLCWAFLRSSDGVNINRTVKESDAVRYTFSGTTMGLAYCSSTLGLRVLSAFPGAQTEPSGFDSGAGETVIWPCERIVAAEVDDDGETLLLIESDGKLYSPRRR